jgi:protein ImuB
MFACIFIPDFSVEAVLRAEPILRGQALAVFEGVPPLCYVVSVNDAAREMRVQVGMTKMQVEGSEEPNGKAQSRNGEQRTENRERRTKNEERGTRNPPLQTTIAERVQQRTEEVGYWHGSLYHSSAGEAVIAPAQHLRSQRARATGLTLRQRSAAQEASAHSALLDAAHAISPRVEDTAIDTVVLDVNGLERLFGTSQQIAQELARRVTEVGLQGNIAIAANSNAAEHAARGFNGVTIVQPGREAERLGVLPLEVLFQAELGVMLRQEKRRDRQRKIADRLTRMQETLDRWGIRNFRGLATLPPVSLSERLGADGVRLQTLASGTATRELVLSEAALHFEETIELEYPVDVLEPLAFLLSRMLEGLCARLNARALSTNELRLRMRLEHRTSDEATKSEEELEGEPIAERKISLPVPMNDAKLFLKLLQLELSALPPGAPVTQLWLMAEPARPRMGQAGLFMPLAPETQKLELTLARIHKLLGVRDALRAGSAELLDTHEPDAFRMVRFQPQSGDRGAEDEEVETTNVDLALRRCRPPFAADVETRDGLPVRLICAELGTTRAQHDNIVWAAGPWRYSGNWWELHRETKPENGKTEKQQSDNGLSPGATVVEVEGQDAAEWAWDREEWDVALAITVRGTDRRERETQIGLYRLVRNCADGCWSVDGSYD